MDEEHQHVPGLSQTAGGQVDVGGVTIQEKGHGTQRQKHQSEGLQGHKDIAEDVPDANEIWRAKHSDNPRADE